MRIGGSRTFDPPYGFIPMRFVFPAFVLVAALAFADDVPQFRGPGGLGHSSEKNLPLRWDEKTNVRWKADLPGRGLSNPVIAGGRVFITAASGANRDRLHVLCFDAKDGKLVWERQFWATGGTQCNSKTTMAAPTPATDGKFVYALFATADLFCLDVDGNLQWTRSFVGDYPTVGNNVGMAASPVIADDVVVIHMENVGESFALGIDRTRGTNKWRVDRPRVINWNTPFVRKEAGKTQVLLMTPGGVTAHDPANGQELWAHTHGKFATSPSILAGDGLIFIPGDKFTADSSLAPADRRWSGRTRSSTSATRLRAWWAADSSRSATTAWRCARRRRREKCCGRTAWREPSPPRRCLPRGGSTSRASRGRRT